MTKLQSSLYPPEAGSKNQSGSERRYKEDPLANGRNFTIVEVDPGADDECIALEGQMHVNAGFARAPFESKQWGGFRDGPFVAGGPRDNRDGLTPEARLGVGPARAESGHDYRVEHEAGESAEVERIESQQQVRRGERAIDTVHDISGAPGEYSTVVAPAPTSCGGRQSSLYGAGNDTSRPKSQKADNPGKGID